MVIPPTTDGAKLADALLASRNGNDAGKANNGGLCHLPVSGGVREAQQRNREGGCPTPFDLVLADEAHRTVGTQKRTRSTDIKGTGNKETPLFTRIHDDELVAAGQRLCMTTTPKVYRDYRRAQSEGGTGRSLLHGR